MNITFDGKDLVHASKGLYDVLRQMINSGCANIIVNVGGGVMEIRNDIELKLFIANRENKQ